MNGVTVAWQPDFERVIHRTGGLVVVREEYPGACAFDEATAIECLRDAQRGGIETLTRLARASNGTFLAAVVHVEERRAYIIGDALGVQPLYWRESAFGRHAASTLDEILTTFENPPPLDLAGVLSQALLSYSFGRRTSFAGVTRSEAATILCLDDRTFSSTSYFEWTSLEARAQPLESGRDRVALAFRSAIEDRLQRDDDHVAFLSGGLDSRAIVASLIGEGARPTTVSIAPPATQDMEYARAFAQLNGLPFFAVDRPAMRRIDWPGLMRQALFQMHRNDVRRVWSGDGGSVCGGCVYLDEALIDAFRAGTDDAQRVLYTKLSLGLPALLRISRPWRDAYAQVVEDFRSAIEESRRVGDDRAAHLFFVLSDQRRHLDHYFNSQSRHRLGFLLPFYDRRVLEAFLSHPLQDRLFHRLYMRWFANLPAQASAVPWQTYPGHEPCPVASEGRLEYQWAPDAQTRELAIKRELVGAGFRQALPRADGGFSLKLASVIAAALHATGLRRQDLMLSIVADLQSARDTASTG